MSLVNLTNHDKRLGVPFVLLVLALFALLVSLFGLQRAAGIANERLNELQTSWDQVQEGTVEGSELIEADRMMARMRVPVPVVRNSARWSLGLAVLSLALLAWLVMVARRLSQQGVEHDDGDERNEQASMLKLMDEISPLASGDLRINATVSESITGGLADAFNYAISELRWVVGSMGNSVQQINESVRRSQESAETITKACSEQTGQIHSSSNLLLTMSGTMAELSADAEESSQTAQNAVDTADGIVGVIDSSLSRLSIIRDDAEKTTRLMQRLANNVTAIDDHVSAVQDVAKRTDLLALNTTIRASAGTRPVSGSDAAADLGRLSDEVAQLAEVLGQATRDISSLTRTISQDAADTIQSMVHTSAELTAGVEQSQQASDALHVIRADSQTIRKHVMDMAQKSVEHSGIVRQLSRNMDVISRITQQTSEGVNTNSESLAELQELANELRQSLSDFQLPARQLPETIQNKEPSDARKAADRAAIHE